MFDIFVVVEDIDVGRGKMVAFHPILSSLRLIAQG